MRSEQQQFKHQIEHHRHQRYSPVVVSKSITPLVIRFIWLMSCRICWRIASFRLVGKGRRGMRTPSCLSFSTDGCVSVAIKFVWRLGFVFGLPFSSDYSCVRCKHMRRNQFLLPSPLQHNPVRLRCQHKVSEFVRSLETRRESWILAIIAKNDCTTVYCQKRIRSPAVCVDRT